MSADRPQSHDSGFGVFSVDTNLVIRTWDDWMAAATGIPAEHALHRPLADVLPEVAERGLLDALLNILRHGTVEVFSRALHEYVIACPPRTPSSQFDRMQQRVSLGPVRDDSRITGAIVTIEDVTVREEYARSVDIAELASALGDERWTARHQAVRSLAERGQSLVNSLVHTLRAQHRNFNVLSSTLDLLTLADVDVVEPMIACLASEDADLRVQAALILGQRRDARAVAPLVGALADSDANVRFHAIEALGRLRASEAADALVRIAESRDFFLAFPAIQALGQIGEISAAPTLVPLLADDMLRAAVVEALGVLGDDVVAAPLAELLADPHAPIDTIADALATLYDRYERRYGAGEQIATIVRRTVTPAATEQLLHAVSRVSADRLRGLVHVLGWLDGAAVHQALTRLLGEATIRSEVVEALVRYGARVVDLLIEQLTAEDLETRQAAAVALGRIGDQRATGALVRALQDEELAITAAGALARIGDGSAFEALLRLIGHHDGAVRHAMIAALNSIGHEDMPSRLAVLLDDANPQVRESAVRIAGYFGYPVCRSGVLTCCADPIESVRRAAVEQLPMFDDDGAIEQLSRSLSDDTAAVRAAAAAAFARVEANAARDPLVRALGDPDAWVRYFALRSLRTMRDAEVTAAVCRCLEHDPAGHVRLAAIDAIGQLQPSDSVGTLGRLCRSDDPDVARAAIRALGHVEQAEAQDVLDAMSRDGDSWRRVAVADAQGQRGGLAPVSSLEWMAAADPDLDVAHAAIDALSVLAARDSDAGSAAIRALVELTAEPSRREAAISGLAQLSASRIDEVACGLSHAAPAVRCAVVAVLSRMRNGAATRLIQQALDDGAASVRAAAAAELRRVGNRDAMRKLVILARADPDAEVRHAAMLATAAADGD